MRVAPARESVPKTNICSETGKGGGVRACARKKGTLCGLRYVLKGYKPQAMDIKFWAGNPNKVKKTKRQTAPASIGVGDGHRLKVPHSRPRAGRDVAERAQRSAETRSATAHTKHARNSYRVLSPLVMMIGAPSSCVHNTNRPKTSSSYSKNPRQSDSPANHYQ